MTIKDTIFMGIRQAIAKYGVSVDQIIMTFKPARPLQSIDLTTWVKYSDGKAEKIELGKADISKIRFVLLSKISEVIKKEDENYKSAILEVNIPLEQIKVYYINQKDETININFNF